MSGGVSLEVPDLVVGEALGLGVDAEGRVEGDHHLPRRVPPPGRLLLVDAELPGHVRAAGHGVGRRHQVPLGHEVGVHVVVAGSAVLVGAGDPVDAEPAHGVVVAEGTPQAGRLDEDLQADLPLEGVVAGGGHVPDDRIGNVGPDVEGGGAGRPVGRALLAADRPPREGGALQAELGRPGASQVEGVVPPPQLVGGGVGDGVRQHRQNERLGVPERMAVVAGTGQALGRDGPPLGPGARLEDVEEGKPHRLLQLAVAVELDVGPLPEVVEVVALAGQEPVPAGVDRAGEGGLHLVPHRRRRAAAGPPVGEELDQPEAFAGLDVGGDGDPTEVWPGRRRDLHRHRPVDGVVHARRHP